MATYRLLRSNKESGPYTFEQLIELGFKPYDLVWAEGKSAAWRYPGELPELKKYAPIVEEQPYDRFYKKPKPNEEIKPTQAVSIVNTFTETSQEEITGKKELVVSTTKKEKAATTAPQRKVYVNMPDNENKEKPVVKVISIRAKRPEPQKQNTPPAKEKKEIIEVPVAEVKYSQSLDEIKEMYRETLVKRKEEYSRRDKMRQALKKLPILLYVLALGLLIGLTINAGKGKKSTVTTDPAIQKNSTQPANLIINTPAAEEEKTNSAANETPPASEEFTNDAVAEKINNNTSVPVKEKTDNKSKIAGSNSPINETEKFLEKQPAATNAETGSRNKAVRDGADAPNTKPAPVTNIKNLVSVSANDYKRGSFGGIKNLELTVTNRSGFMLDNVVVELNYLKPSEETLSTEKINFSGVSPNGSLTIRIPDNSRGIKVKCKVFTVESAEYKQHLAGL